MAKIVKIQPQTLTDIAEAIREKTKTTESIPTVEMAQRIRDIETLPTDATAVSEDLLAGKVAYNNDGRFVGSIEEFTGGFEEDTVKSDLDIYNQIVEGTIEVFDLDMEIDNCQGCMDELDVAFEEIKIYKAILCSCVPFVRLVMLFCAAFAAEWRNK